MNSIIATSDFTSALFLLIVLFGIVFQIKQKSNAARVFLLALISGIFFSIIDGLSFALIGKEGIDVLLIILNSFSFVGTDIIFIFFALYIYRCISLKRSVSPWLIRPVYILCGLNAFAQLILGLTGVSFTVVNGVYSRSTLGAFGGVITAVAALYVFILIIAERDALELKNAILLCAFIILPLATTLVELFNENISIIYPSLNLSLAIVYVTFQNSESQKQSLEKSLMNKLLRRDTLTGIKNRRAYEETIQSLKGFNNVVRVISCDLNGLKYANDTFGHGAGDKLILTFVDVLTSCFPTETLYRISGDEFVVILVNEAEADFRDRCAVFKKKNMENSWISAVGTASGIGEDILNILMEAEKQMYADKEAYYIATKKDRRVQNVYSK